MNCNAQLAGSFCHICGQENIEPKETVWHLITHFFNDITHFDGKFFSTVGLLIRRPGLLPKEYMLGRRASYLNPVRMYIFTSAVFFLIFFSIFHFTDKKFEEVLKIENKSLDEIRSLSPDSLKNFTAKINNGKSIPAAELGKYLDSIKYKDGFNITSRKYRSKQEYDSVLKSGVKQHNWLERKLIYKEIEANEKYHNNKSQFFTSFMSAFLHSFPQMLFISLPLFALFLRLLYWRRKEYYYVSHGIFSIHFYIFIFIAMLVIFGLGELKELLHWEWLKFLRGLLGITIFFYLYKAMRNFYQQRRAKTIIKFLLLNFLTFIMLAFLFIVFILFSFMKI
ncbi:MAG: DUF3667 domain-containing protein [Ferruginibacter sp.]|nr:DUF3667 domain-containing protein [Ferruginibacter sp.]